MLHLGVSMNHAGIFASANLLPQLAELVTLREDPYTPFECAANVRHLISEALPNDQHDSAQALIFLNQQTRSWEAFKMHRYPLYPVSRCGPRAKWVHHCVLSVENRIYDFDFSGPAGLLLADYAAQMFGQAVSNIDIVQVPVADFAQQLGAILFATFYGERYPRVSLDSAINLSDD